MTDPSRLYRRLPGQGANAIQRVTLYLGDDHLLLVSSSGYAENYKRFYFPDIQAITVRKSVGGKVWNIVWGSLLALSTLLALSLGGVAQGVWLGIAALFLLGLMRNLALGPTCLCQIRTAVQVQPIASLNRFPQARKIIAQLRPLLEAVQQPLSREEMLRQLEESRRNPAFVSSPPASNSP